MVVRCLGTFLRVSDLLCAGTDVYCSACCSDIIYYILGKMDCMSEISRRLFVQSDLAYNFRANLALIPPSIFIIHLGSIV